MCNKCKNQNSCPNKLRDLAIAEAIATLLEEKKDKVEIAFPCKDYIPKIISLEA